MFVKSFFMEIKGFSLFKRQSSPQTVPLAAKKKPTAAAVGFCKPWFSSNQLSLDWLTLMPGPMVDAITQDLIY